jgi:hypothetical protein
VIECCRNKVTKCKSDEKAWLLALHTYSLQKQEVLGSALLN